MRKTLTLKSVPNSPIKVSLSPHTFISSIASYHNPTRDLLLVSAILCICSALKKLIPLSLHLALTFFSVLSRPQSSLETM